MAPRIKQRRYSDSETLESLKKRICTESSSDMHPNIAPFHKDAYGQLADGTKHDPLTQTDSECNKPLVPQAVMEYLNSKRSERGEESIWHKLGLIAANPQEPLPAMSTIQTNVLLEACEELQKDVKELKQKMSERLSLVLERLETRNRNHQRLVDIYEKREFAYRGIVKTLFERLWVLIRQECLPFSRTQADEEVRAYKELIVLWRGISGQGEESIRSMWESLRRGYGQASSAIDDSTDLDDGTDPEANE